MKGKPSRKGAIIVRAAESPSVLPAHVRAGRVVPRVVVEAPTDVWRQRDLARAVYRAKRRNQ